MWVSEIKPTLKGRLDTAACYQHLNADLYAGWIVNGLMADGLRGSVRSIEDQRPHRQVKDNAIQDVPQKVRADRNMRAYGVIDRAERKRGQEDRHRREQQKTFAFALEKMVTTLTGSASNPAPMRSQYRSIIAFSILLQRPDRSQRTPYFLDTFRRQRCLWWQRRPDRITLEL